MTRPEDHGDEPLDPEMDRLLEAERARPERSGVDPSADRLFARVIATVGPAGGAGGAPPPEGGAPAAGGGGAASATSAWAHPALVGTVTLVIGMAVGAVMHASLATPEVRVVVREVTVDAGVLALAEPAPPPVPEPVPEPVPDSLPSPEPEPEPGSLPDSPSTSDSTPDRLARRPDAGAPTSLARESALLARAQSALARGAPELAIAALREHDTRHPEGQLREEREALWISALVAAGDRDAALERAARFRRRFPGSPLQPAVDAALRSP